MLVPAIFMFFNKFASCSIPYLNFFIGDGLALALNSFWWFTHIVTIYAIKNYHFLQCNHCLLVLRHHIPVFWLDERFNKTQTYIIKLWLAWRLASGGGPGFKSRQGWEFINVWLKRKFNNYIMNTIIVWVYELTGQV